jgi:hypothetical protein
MPITLDQVVPWGRSLDEYVRMFDLSPADLELKILDCAGGPASFNAEMHARRRSVVSCDPIYQFSEAEIARRIDETYPVILAKTNESRENFRWEEMKSLEHLGAMRMAAMRRFLADLTAGLVQGRYRVAELPSLPFSNQEFDIALCSHFLFTYSHLLTAEFHMQAIRELCRVAREARVFPLVPNFADARSSHVEAVMKMLGAEGYAYEIRRVPHEFQKGGNEMFRISRRQSAPEPSRKGSGCEA